ncbi:MAG: AraC family transcriptional regulator [Verrucomicrobiota bacterium]
MTRQPGQFLQVFWTVAGDGRFALDGRELAVPAGCVFYYAAGEPHGLTAGADGWDFRWLTFDGPRFAGIIGTYGLRRQQVGGACPAELFEELDVALQNPTPSGETRASVLAYDILTRAGLPADSGAPVLPDALAARAWIDAHYTDPRLNVAALCARLKMHRASLHRVFTRSFGVAPVQYLGRLRLRLGLELLNDTRLPVAEVAMRCGVPDVAYFSKLVSRHTGYSPRLYRQRQIRIGDGQTANAAT